MKPEVKRWLDKAEHDFNTAKYNFKGDILDAAIFYAQQSVEKGLKTLLIQKEDKFQRTHDLVKLATKINAPKIIIELCAAINPSYTVSRYPDVEQTFSKKECENIIDSSEEVLKWIKERLH